MAVDSVSALRVLAASADGCAGTSPLMCTKRDGYLSPDELQVVANSLLNARELAQKEGNKKAAAWLRAKYHEIKELRIPRAKKEVAKGLPGIAYLDSRLYGLNLSGAEFGLAFDADINSHLLDKKKKLSPKDQYNGVPSRAEINVLLSRSPSLYGEVAKTLLPKLESVGVIIRRRK